MTRRTVVTAAALVTMIAVNAPAAHASPARATAGQRVVTTTAAALAALPVRAEVTTGYDRDLFTHWVDVDGNGCDTRQEVLIDEDVATSPRLDSSCDVVGGRWTSWYDGVTTTDSSSFDVDHVVPLAEAWGSGASAWGARRRQAYANDLGEPRALVAVTASSNRSKGDSDPAEWLPAHHRCRYAAWWLAVKSRWRLSIDATEHDALARLVDRCGDHRLRYRVAKVTRTDGGSTSDAAPSRAGDLPSA